MPFDVDLPTVRTASYLDVLMAGLTGGGLVFVEVLKATCLLHASHFFCSKVVGLGYKFAVGQALQEEYASDVEDPEHVVCTGGKCVRFWAECFGFIALDIANNANYMGFAHIDISGHHYFSADRSVHYADMSRSFYQGGGGGFLPHFGFGSFEPSCRVDDELDDHHVCITDSCNAGCG
jgi:hypothetical protein